MNGFIVTMFLPILCCVAAFVLPVVGDLPHRLPVSEPPCHQSHGELSVHYCKLFHNARSWPVQAVTHGQLHPFPLRGGAGPLRSSAVVNFLTGEAVDEVTVVDVDSDDDMRGAKPVDWLPRGGFLLPEERRRLSDDHGDFSDPEHGRSQSPLSKGGRRSKKASGAANSCTR